jgi:hypothetical protein
LKRFALAAMVMVAMLVGAGSAFAAVNNYTATYKFSGKAGTASKPAPLSFTQDIKVTPGTPGSRAGLLHTITTTIAGANVKIGGGKADTCSIATITGAANFNGACPKSSLIATGFIDAVLGPADFTQPGQACNPNLDVYNAGPGKLTFFFVAATSGAHACLGGQIHTGQVAPYPATYKNVGKNLSVTIPIPNFVDQPVPSLFGSLEAEHLVWKSSKIGGVQSITSTGCKGKRKYTWAFNASLPGAAAETVKSTGAAACG